MGKQTMGKQIALLMSNATMEWLPVWVCQGDEVVRGVADLLW